MTGDPGFVWPIVSVTPTGVTFGETDGGQNLWIACTRDDLHPCGEFPGVKVQVATINAEIGPHNQPFDFLSYDPVLRVGTWRIRPPGYPAGYKVHLHLA